MNTTKTISKFELDKGYTRPGPWRCTYRVTTRTAAVNVAQKGKYLAEEVATGETFNTVRLGLEALSKAAGNGSIDGFWGEQLQRFTPDALAAVAAEAEALLARDSDAGYGSADDLGEQDDGQR